MNIFGSNVNGPPHPRGGKVALAVEEGMVRNIANRVTSDGIGAFDACFDVLSRARRHPGRGADHRPGVQVAWGSLRSSPSSEPSGHRVAMTGPNDQDGVGLK